MADKIVNELAAQLKFMENEQAQGWKAHWQDIGNYILPFRFVDATAGQKPNKGEKKHTYILNGTATTALQFMASGMHGGLTSPSRPWFRLLPVDPELNEYGPVRDYLDDCERIMYKRLSSSNFYTTIHNIYKDLIGFSTGLIYCLEDENKVFRFQMGTVGTYYLSEGIEGTCDTVFRRYWMTARQVVESFRDAVSQSTKKMAEDNPFDWVEIIHLIRPRKNRDSRKLDNQNMAWESLYYEYGGDQTLLRKSGFEEQPFMATRWDTAGGNVYGCDGPGMIMLGDTKTLQEMERTYLMALHKAVNPPLAVPDRMKSNVSLIPGAANPVAANEVIKPIMEIKADLPAADNKIMRMEQKIEKGFFNDLFLMIAERPNMTATEVIQRNEEKMIMLGPVIERQFYELLNPCLDRVWGILTRNGHLPEPPEEIQGQELKVEYISLLAQAQKAVATKSIDRIIGVTTQLAQTHPEVIDKLNADEVVDQYGEMLNVPSNIILSDEKVSEKREQRAKAQQAQVEMERQAQEQKQITEGARTMRELSQTPVGDGTALDLVR